MTNTYLTDQLDDIIFESRNKAYGAYALRQAYGKHMKRGTIVGLSLFALLISSPLIADRMAVSKKDLDNSFIEMKEIPLEDIKKPPVVPPPPPPPPPVKQVATQRFQPPVVTEEAETEPPMPKIEDITVNVSTETRKGENVETFVNVVQAPTPPPFDGPEEVVKKEEETIFVTVEQMPEFKDGERAMFRFLADNYKVPALARENGIDGTVYVGFVIDREGEVRDVMVKRGIGGGCNEEAVRVISMMPKWKPGRQNGKAVNVAFTLPIKVRLE